MDVRAQVSMVFHLDKCIGCHTCSVSCKNVWTDRRGAEYMWWNNVESRPGTGYPTLWEDQEKYRGGWEKRGRGLELRLQGRAGSFAIPPPRTCTPSLNPPCTASCPAGAIYKRGEDGIVLVSQEKCRAWRMCISGCPYKKVYYNWESGKTEKCTLCYPRVETGQAPACFHSCVGRLRYQGG